MEKYGGDSNEYPQDIFMEKYGKVCLNYLRNEFHFFLDVYRSVNYVGSRAR